jgi:Zn-dependent protease
MGTHIQIGRFFGIPIVLDMFFVLILIVAYAPFWMSGNTQLMSAGLIIATGLVGSILLHEIGHAVAGALFRQKVVQIELTGLGGITEFERSLTASVPARTAIFLAGPAANLLLWLGLGALVETGMTRAYPFLTFTIATIAQINFWLLVFNLLPAFPLDGGRTLDTWLGRILGSEWSVRIVAVLGLVCALAVVAWALPSNFWLLLVAFFLAQFNWAALQSVGGLSGRR